MALFASLSYYTYKKIVCLVHTISRSENIRTAYYLISEHIPFMVFISEYGSVFMCVTLGQHHNV